MKTYKNLYDEFISKENFELAYKNAIKKKSSQPQIKEFKLNADENLEMVRQLVIVGKFHTSKYTIETIYEPKKREIYKLPFCPDRIVQHAVMNILKPIMLRHMITNTYACIENRGQAKAGLKCSEYVRKYRYCLKCDIRKFYPSINQKILSGMLHRLIKDDKFMSIVDDIIFSVDGGYNCPIGNYCSQWFGNFYLTKLDNFVCHELHCGSYERYCDDFLLFSDDKKYLQECKTKIKQFLNDELELEFSKSDVFDVKQGVDFVGYRYFKDYVLVRKSTSKRIQKRLRGIEETVKTGNYDISRILGQLSSANGILSHACTWNFRKNIKLDELTQIVTEFSEKIN